MTAKAYYSALLTSGTIAAALVLVGLFSLSPKTIGPIGVTVWFLFLLFGMAALVACGLFRLKVRTPQIENTEEKLLQNSWRQGWLIAGSLVAILALSSLRQLAWRDVFIIFGVMAVLEIFLRSRP